MEEDNQLSNKSVQKITYCSNTKITDSSYVYLSKSLQKGLYLPLRSMRKDEFGPINQTFDDKQNQKSQKNSYLPPIDHKIQKNRSRRCGEQKNSRKQINRSFSSETDKLSQLLNQLDTKLRKLQIENIAIKRINQSYPELSYLNEQYGMHSNYNELRIPHYTNHYYLRNAIPFYPSYPGMQINPLQSPYPAHFQQAHHYFPGQFNQFQHFPNNDYSIDNFSRPNKLQKITQNPGSNSVIHSRKNIRIKSGQEQQYNKNDRASHKESIDKKLSKHKGSKQLRLSKLLKKFRKCVWAIIFVKLLPKYCSCIKVLHYEKFKQENQSEMISNAQRQLCSIFSTINFIQLYQESEQQFKQIREGNKDESVGFKIIQDNIEFLFEFQIGRHFIATLIQQLRIINKSQEIKEVYPLLVHFLNGEFPLHDIFLIEQLKALSFNSHSGALNITQSQQNLLLSNYMVIKIFVHQLFFQEKQISHALKKKVVKNQKEKKKAVLDGKKIKICVLFLFLMANQMFDQQFPEEDPNFYQLSQRLRPVPKQELSFFYKFSKEEVTSQQRKLIKNIVGLDSIYNKFKNYLDQQRLQLKNVFSDLHADLREYQVKKHNELKAQVLSQPLKLKKIKFRLPKYIKPDTTTKQEINQ